MNLYVGKGAAQMPLVARKCSDSVIQKKLDELQRVTELFHTETRPAVKQYNEWMTLKIRNQIVQAIDEKDAALTLMRSKWTWKDRLHFLFNREYR